MKRRFLTITFALALITSVATFAQKHNQISRSIDDDGSKLSISVNGMIDGKNIRYDRTFLVAGLTKEERKDITQEVFDSLGLGSIEAPESAVASEPPGKRSAPGAVIFPTEKSATHPGETTETVTGNPYTKEIKFDSTTGEMHLKYQFVRDGEEFVYEKTVDAASKSTRQREEIVRNFEAEIALPSGR